MSKTIQPTEYGDHEIELVECDSCEQTVPKDMTTNAVVGPWKIARYARGEVSKYELHASKGEKLWLCESCIRDGPSGVRIGGRTVPFEILLLVFILGFAIGSWVVMLV